MTDREKLVELLNEVFADQYEKRGLITAEHTAEYLLSHGVTVREQQKPLDLVDAIEADDPVWIEHSLTFMDMEVIKIYPIDYCDRRFYADGILRGERINEKSMLLKKDDYGKDWRCWAEKPTEEERKDAEWEK